VTITGTAKVYDGTATNGGNNIYNIGSYTLNADDGCVFITDSDDKGIYTP